MEQHLLNRLKTEDPEFEVTKGTELVLKTNSTFILNNCLVTFNLKEIKNFYLVSKNSYLIGVVVQPSLDNFVFFPSQTACFCLSYEAIKQTNTQGQATINRNTNSTN